MNIEQEIIETLYKSIFFSDDEPHIRDDAHLTTEDIDEYNHWLESKLTDDLIAKLKTSCKNNLLNGNKAEQLWAIADELIPCSSPDAENLSYINRPVTSSGHHCPLCASHYQREIFFYSREVNTSFHFLLCIPCLEKQIWQYFNQQQLNFGFFERKPIPDGIVHLISYLPGYVLPMETIPIDLPKTFYARSSEIITDAGYAVYPDWYINTADCGKWYRCSSFRVVHVYLCDQYHIYDDEKSWIGGFSYMGGYSNKHRYKTHYYKSPKKEETTLYSIASKHDDQSLAIEVNNAEDFDISISKEIKQEGLTLPLFLAQIHKSLLLDRKELPEFKLYFYRNPERPEIIEMELGG